MLEKYLRDTLSAVRWKEVERIEGTEIILPVVKMKRRKLDSLRREKMKVQVKRFTAGVQSTNQPASEHSKNITFKHIEAIIKDEESLC